MPNWRSKSRHLMFKHSFLVALTLAIAIGGGTASVWYALQIPDAIGAVSIGEWTAFPDIGTSDADPYSKAKVSREGVLALGRAEGLSFIAQRDASGAELRRGCSYTIEGTVPPARFWTLYAADETMSVIAGPEGRAPALHSYEMLRQPDNSVSISVGRHPAPGNWLAVSGGGKMFFVLTLYDTTIASSTGITNVELPHIVKVACDA
ncbi:hypothetical protein M2281_000647 [Mesorhizobium soli]|nr:hypothetical protein [Mesorhizobium soli]